MRECVCSCCIEAKNLREQGAMIILRVLVQTIPKMNIATVVFARRE